MSDLAKELRIMAGMITMCERISFGSDSALMKKAATEIDRLERENAELQIAHNYFKNGMAELQDCIDKTEPGNAVIKEALNKAHDLLSGMRHYPDYEHYDFIKSAASTPAPAQCLAEIKAQAVEEFKKKAQGIIGNKDVVTGSEVFYALDHYANQLRQHANPLDKINKARDEASSALQNWINEAGD